ncbi:MAG: holo-ACP synthase [Acidobacteriia bacterium]|nr:holo-ACP synthase [Terriglobia bacterium]
MIIGIGIDHVEIAKFRTDVEVDELGFVGRIFTESEVTYARSTDDYLQRLAGRFAAKEATLKALGTGWTAEIDWKQIEISNDPFGKPRIILRGQAAELATAAGAKQFFVSISHSPHLATAEVIIEA